MIKVGNVQRHQGKQLDPQAYSQDDLSIWDQIAGQRESHPEVVGGSQFESKMSKLWLCYVGVTSLSFHYCQQRFIQWDSERNTADVLLGAWFSGLNIDI